MKRYFSIIFTEKQYQWLLKKSKSTGVAMTNVIRMWINEQIKKDSGKNK